MTPKQRVLAACAKHGATDVVQWCVRLLGGAHWDDPGDPDLTWIGGASVDANRGSGWLDKPVNEYWPRVWAARALLYVWHPTAAAAVVKALSDPAWRVREMAAKVARLRGLGEAGDALSTLVEDETTRVRLAAVRALALVGEGEHAPAVIAAQDDAEQVVRQAAGVALNQMSERLDRPF